jgi:3-oxoadipate enol-lactonase
MNLTIGNETFNVSVEGDETLPPVILSHALGGDHRIWNRILPDLTKHFRVVRYDSRGHGGSAVGDGPYSIADLGRDALALLDSLNIQKAHWIGISMGGAVGQWVLAHAPDRIERAVLANTTAHFGAPDLWNERIIAAQQHGMEAVADVTLKRWFSDAFAEAEANQVKTRLRPAMRPAVPHFVTLIFARRCAGSSTPFW